MSLGHVVAYHGCDITTRDNIVSGRIKSLKPSANKYDWLGDGVYFYEEDHERAMQYARYSAEHCELHLTAKAIGTPAVVGAVLDVSRWLDVTIQPGIEHFKTALRTVEAGVAQSGNPLPENRPAFEGDSDNLHRALDRAVFQTVHTLREFNQQNAMADGDAAAVQAFAPFQAVRGAFTQGAAVNAHSAIHGQSHIQIALRDKSCVMGWFLLPGDKLCTPEEYEFATTRLADAHQRKSNAKPRRRAA